MNYKKEYQRAKTKLEFVQAVGLTMFYVGLVVIWIMRQKGVRKDDTGCYSNNDSNTISNILAQKNKPRYDLDLCIIQFSNCGYLCICCDKTLTIELRVPEI